LLIEPSSPIGDEFGEEIVLEQQQLHSTDLS
jgi:hypothetical protein